MVHAQRGYEGPSTPPPSTPAMEVNRGGETPRVVSGSCLARDRLVLRTCDECPESLQMLFEIKSFENLEPPNFLNKSWHNWYLKFYCLVEPIYSIFNCYRKFTDWGVI